MSEVERPNRLAPGRRIAVDDIRELVGGCTPHFALQIRQRIRRLIKDLPPDDAARVEGEREITRLERMAEEGQISGPVQDHERPLPSLKLGSKR